MTLDELHQIFKLELDKTTALELPAFLAEEIDDWLNMAIRKFVKTRYAGVNPKREAFEQTQKRVDDLRSLVREQALVCTTASLKPNSYSADLTSLSLGLDEIKGAEGKEILAPLGRGIFVKTKLLSEDLTVDVGCKNSVKKNVSQTNKILEAQMKKPE